MIDSGGGPIAAQVARLLKDGGIIACYGQTSGKPIDVSMAVILKNIELRGESFVFSSSRVEHTIFSARSFEADKQALAGSTMGSRDEFFAAVKMVAEHKIQPVVDSVLNGLDQAEEGFQLLKRGGQFGKVRRTRPALFRRSPTHGAFAVAGRHQHREGRAFEAVEGVTRVEQPVKGDDSECKTTNMYSHRRVAKTRACTSFAFTWNAVEGSLWAINTGETDEAG